MTTGLIVQRHVTINAYDDDYVLHSVSLAPGDEIPDWAPDDVKNNELLFKPLPEDEDQFADNPDVGVGVFKSGNVPEDHTAPANIGKFDDSPVSYDAMKRDELAELCRERELAVSGSRQELVQRLLDDDAAKG